jgi:hypothetical protein
MMHVLAILFVLASLVLAFGVIGGMLFAHRERIGEALAGNVVMPVQEQKQSRRVKPRTSRASVTPMVAMTPIPLAA